jgi:hypothetical protein
MSPELYRKLDGNQKKFNYSPEQNDIFALGMSLLHLGNQRVPKSVYGPKGTYSQGNLDVEVAEFENRHKDSSPIAC